MKSLAFLIILLSSQLAFADNVIDKPNNNPVSLLNNTTIQEICKGGHVFILVKAYEFTIGLSRTYKYVISVDIEQVYVRNGTGGLQPKECTSE